jgi:outer membrane protein OmpA-like peptidoglycan-associated protein
VAQAGLATARASLASEFTFSQTFERRPRPGAGFRILQEPTFGGLDVQVFDVRSNAGFMCTNGTPAPFGGSEVHEVAAGIVDQTMNAVVIPADGDPVDLDPEVPGSVVAHANERVITATGIIQRALVIERPARGVRLVFGEARAGVDGNPCLPDSPTTPTTPTTPGEAQVGAIVSTGRPGDELVINGSGFGASQGADDRITVRGEPAAATQWSDTRIVVLVPNLTPGPGELRLRIRGVEKAGPAFDIVADPPQPPVVNLLVVPLPGGRLLVDTSLTVDPDTSRPGAPAARGDNTTFDLYDGLRTVLTRIDGGPPSRKATQVKELTPGKHEIAVTATANDGRRSTVTKRVFVPQLSPLQRIANLTRVRVKPTRVPPADITIPSQLLFGVGSSDLRPEAGRFLTSVARALKIAKAPARITGYTDATGPEDFNRRLSRERARAVRAFLAGRGRVPAKRMTAFGLGEREPVASNATAEGRQRNRRVVVSIKVPTKATVLTGRSATKRLADVRNLQARARAESRRPNRPPPSGAPDGIGIYEHPAPWLKRAD